MAFVTPSGTNDFHGNAYWSNRNNYFKAYDFFSNQSGTEVPFLNQNQIGGSLGGHINVVKTILDQNATFDFAGSSVGRPWWKASKRHFAPNLGLAFDPTGSGKWATRAGYSISYVNDKRQQSNRFEHTLEFQAERNPIARAGTACRRLFFRVNSQIGANWRRGSVSAYPKRFAPLPSLPERGCEGAGSSVRGRRSDS